MIFGFLPFWILIMYDVNVRSFASCELLPGGLNLGFKFFDLGVEFPNCILNSAIDVNGTRGKALGGTSISVGSSREFLCGSGIPLRSGDKLFGSIGLSIRS